MQKQHWKKLQSMANMFMFKRVTSKLSNSCYQALVTIEIIKKVYQKYGTKGAKIKCGAVAQKATCKYII
jgi:hypothetical protein